MNEWICLFIDGLNATTQWDRTKLCTEIYASKTVWNLQSLFSFLHPGKFDWVFIPILLQFYRLQINSWLAPSEGSKKLFEDSYYVIIFDVLTLVIIRQTPTRKRKRCQNMCVDRVIMEPSAPSCVKLPSSAPD